MPCRSDYMEATPSERRAKRAAELLLWLNNSMIDPVDRTGGFLTEKEYRKFEQQSNNYYAAHVGQTEMLCAVVKMLKEEGTLDDFLQNNFRDKRARDLADWIDEHEEADRRREESKLEATRRAYIDEIVEGVRGLDDKSLHQIAMILKPFQK